MIYIMSFIFLKIEVYSYSFHAHQKIQISKKLSNLQRNTLQFLKKAVGCFLIQ